MANLPDIAMDAVPRHTPIDSELQPLRDDQLSTLQNSLSSVDLPSSTLNMVSNSVRSAATNVTVISNSQNVHMGSVFHHTVLGACSDKSKKNKGKKFVKPSPEVEAMMQSNQSVTTAHVRDVTLGSGWRKVMRKLDLDDVEIENKHEQYFHQGGVEEVVYQLLRVWIEMNGSAATLAKLSTVLWKKHETKALAALAEAFKVNVLSSSCKESV